MILFCEWRSLLWSEDDRACTSFLRAWSCPSFFEAFGYCSPVQLEQEMSQLRRSEQNGPEVAVL